MSRGLRLVYGGAHVELMGLLADTVLSLGGEVTGVIPHGLEVREPAHTDLSELHVTDTMHERKALMGDLADGFIALPGGLGTLEEFAEVLTWSQLGLQPSPAGCSTSKASTPRCWPALTTCSMRASCAPASAISCSQTPTPAVSWTR